MSAKTLGVLGGLGPLSGVYFCEMLITHTAAHRDQDHLNFLLSSWAQTPDRTAFILGQSSEDPAAVMIRQVRGLTEGGAQIIAIPCNTAHYFYDRISDATSVPVLNIIEETVAFCRQSGIRRIGVLATKGTVDSSAYETACRQIGLEYLTCTPKEQELVSHMIYGQIKQGALPRREELTLVADRLRSRGCECVVLGCTELSLLKRQFSLGEEFIDSLEVLACAAIRACGKEPVGFSPALMKFQPTKGNCLCC